MRVFLLSINTDVVARQAAQDYLDTLAEVHNWFSVLPGTIFVVSTGTVQSLSELLRGHFVGAFFVLTEVARGFTDGNLPVQAWDFINNPKPSGRQLSQPPPFPPYPGPPNDVVSSADEQSTLPSTPSLADLIEGTLAGKNRKS